MFTKAFLFTMLAAVTANATTVVIINNTRDVIRIDELRDKCKGVLVSPSRPIIIKSGARKLLKLNDIVHLVTICGQGLCTSSAIGIERGTPVTRLNVVDSDTGIEFSQKPNTWPGNLECK